MLRELHLASTGRVDTATAPRVGRLLRARHLVLGAVTELPGRQIRVDARIADVPSASVRLAVSARSPLDDLLDAEKALAFSLFDQLGVTLTPKERAAVEQRPTRSLVALLAYGRAVRYEVDGLYGESAAEYQRALRADPGFSLARTRLEDVQSVAGVRLTDAAGAAVDRVNSKTVPNLAERPGGVADPSFPSTRAVVLITVSLP
jgi:hypothetical protein